MAPINPNDPFGFASNYDKNFWGTAQTYSGDWGARATNHGLAVGVFNQADNQGSPSSSFNSDNNVPSKSNAYQGPNGAYETGVSPVGNGGNGSGSDFQGDVTVINTAVAFNPPFASDNVWTGSGSIGLYGRSRGKGFSVGVMGQSSKGCAIYGLATDEHPRASDLSHGIGVVGRSMAGNPIETPVVPNELPEEFLADGQGIGVLAVSASGPGIRGHSGSLPTDNHIKPAPGLALAQPGGWFSSGDLSRFVHVLKNMQEVSSGTPQPQLRLTPSISGEFPQFPVDDRH